MTINPLAFTPHDHKHCIETALQEAEKLCTRHGTRLTSLRRRVLLIIWQSHKPLGAYDILNVLAVEDGRSAAPPTVYRALDFLLENNLIHRIASCNAFIGCTHPAQQHEGYFLICSTCGNVIELEQVAINKAIEQAAKQTGFVIQGQTVEIIGLCSSCREHPNE